MSETRPPKISACIIARDEAPRLPACLASVAFCDEVVLVDSGSTDDTVKIATAAGARVIEQPWLGFPAQRNVALDNALGEWVLEIDADERVTPDLATEILSFIADPPAEVDLGGLPLSNLFLGRFLGPSAKYPEYRRRLLRRESYRHEESRTVHEGLIPHGPVHPFTHDLEHLLADNLGEALGDAWRYARLEAGQMQSPLTLATFVRGALLRPAVKFLYRLTVDGGWRDGWRGVVKMAIDCAIDTIVWFRHLLGRRGDRHGQSGVQGSQHYGAVKFRRGSPRVVGVAAEPVASARAIEWLRAARTAGADVALVGDATVREEALQIGDEQGAIRVRRTPRRMGPLTLIRALEAEEQLRTIDAVILFGARARLLSHALPVGLRGSTHGYGESCDPRIVCQRIKPGLGHDWHDLDLGGGNAPQAPSPQGPTG
jgi:glycosyltransferase involved in cell wall biosynthesis